MVRRFLLFDLGLLLVACVPAILLCFTRAFPPQRRGFFLDNAELSYPHLHESVPMVTVAIVSSVVPLFVLFVLEYRLQRQYRANIDLLPDYLATRLIGKTIVFLFGFVLTAVWASWMKLAIGRHRPDFIELCSPTVQRPYPHQYVYENVCANYVYDGYLSFPSGHTAIAFYGMLFAAMYVWFFLSVTSRLFKPLVAFGLLTFPVYVGLSRVADNAHFGSDVAAGAILGTLMAGVAFWQAQSVDDIDAKQGEQERDPLLGERTRLSTNTEGLSSNTVRVDDTPTQRSRRGVA